MMGRLQQHPLFNMLNWRKMMINLVILTGIDGSGKSSALNIFKEANYYVAFNIPLEVMKSFFDTILFNKNYENIAICVPLNIANDVRFLPNPYWVDDLKELNGLDSKVKDYVLNFPQTKKFLSEAIKYLDYYFDEVKKAEEIIQILVLHAQAVNIEV